MKLLKIIKILVETRIQVLENKKAYKQEVHNHQIKMMQLQRLCKLNEIKHDNTISILEKKLSELMLDFKTIDV